MLPQGYREWSNPLEMAPSQQPDPLTWASLFAHWNAIELDLHDWGIDVESGILDHRSWRWFLMRVLDLIDSASPRSSTSRLKKVLTAERSTPNAA